MEGGGDIKPSVREPINIVLVGVSSLAGSFPI